MPTTLTTHAIERSTFVISASFTDEAGEAVAPTSITWTLTDDYGTIINSREGEAVTPATSVDIVLSGADLAITEASASVIRKMTVEATYNSSFGTGLPLKDQVTFQIDNLTAVT